MKKQLFLIVFFLPKYDALFGVPSLEKSTKTLILTKSTKNNLDFLVLYTMLYLVIHIVL